MTIGGRPSELADGRSLGIAETFVALGVVAQRVGDGFHLRRHRLPPTSKADSIRTTTRVTSASDADVMTILCRVEDCFASELRLVLVKIQPSLVSVKYRNFIQN